AVTPIQMAQAYTAIAEGGVMRPPYVIESDRGRERRGLPRRVAIQVSRLLEGALAAGGARPQGRGRREARRARRVLEDQVRSLLHRLRARPRPPATGGGDGGRAQGPDLRRRGGGARLREDHGLRAPLPPDSPWL